MTEMNLFLFVTNLVVIALCGALLPIIPLLTRRAFLFGVRVPESAQTEPESRALRRQYVTVSIVGALILLALVTAQYLLFPDMMLLATMYFPLLIIPLQMLAFVPCHRRAKRLKAEKRWSVSAVSYAETRSSNSRGKLSNVPWLYYIISLIIIIASVVALLAKYPDIPDPMPTHFDINMQPDAWSPKTIMNVVMMPLVNFAMALLMAVLGASIEKVRLQTSSENPALSFAQHRVYRRRMGHACGIMTLGLVAGLSLMGLMMVFPKLTISFAFMMALMLLPIAPLVVISIGSGQGGCRLKPQITDVDRISSGNAPEKQKIVAPAHADDRFWALGMFYHNPDDPAILVEDRFGSNMGFNYSRLSVKIGVALMLALLVGLYVWITVIFSRTGVF